jgi:hypothetical protein
MQRTRAPPRRQRCVAPSRLPPRLRRRCARPFSNTPPAAVEAPPPPTRTPPASASVPAPRRVRWRRSDDCTRAPAFTPLRRPPLNVTRDGSRSLWRVLGSAAPASTAEPTQLWQGRRGWSGDRGRSVAAESGCVAAVRAVAALLSAHSPRLRRRLASECKSIIPHRSGSSYRAVVSCWRPWAHCRVELQPLTMLLQRDERARPNRSSQAELSLETVRPQS